MTQHFDYFVIGGGSGGVRSARIAATHGAKVGLAEKNALGGTCVNVGCVPKKLLAYAADYGMALKDMEGYGYHNVHADFKWKTLRQNKDDEIARLNKAYQNTLAKAGVHFFEGKAGFVDANTLQIGDQTITADKILIATGGTPKRPTYPGHDLVNISDDFFYMDELPKHAVLQGGGYIGVEFAHILHGLGVKVTILNRSPVWLREFDEDVQDFLRNSCMARGMDIRMTCDITQVNKDAEGNLLVHTTDQETIECDRVFSVIGRVPNTHDLGADKAGVDLNEGGQVRVDDDWTTTAEHIYAVGDVCNKLNLTPYAIAEGHILADCLFSDTPPRQADFKLVPTAVFSTPPIGSVGLSESEAREEGYKLKIFKAEFRPMKNTLAGNSQKDFIKMLVCRDTDKVLGLHMVGEDAPEIMQGFATALIAGATKADFDRTIGIHPTSAEEIVTMREPVSVD